MSVRREPGGIDNRFCFFSRINMWDNDSCRAIVEHSSNHTGVLWRYPHQRWYACPHRARTQHRCGFQRCGGVLEIDVDRVVSTCRGDGGDIGSSRVHQRKAKHQAVAAECVSQW